jgi:hypothetical protein
VVAAAAAASFMLAWAVELWLVVLAIPSGAVLMITFWVRTRWRLLPRVIAVETVTAVDDTWDDQERTSIALALTARGADAWGGSSRPGRSLVGALVFTGSHHRHGGPGH